MNTPINLRNLCVLSLVFVDEYVATYRNRNHNPLNMVAIHGQTSNIRTNSFNHKHLSTFLQGCSDVFYGQDPQKSKYGKRILERISKCNGSSNVNIEIWKNLKLQFHFDDPNSLIAIIRNDV